MNYFALFFRASKLPPVPPKKRIIRTGLPAKERTVCARLREVRQHLRLTQTEFAAQIGISRERLASYEDARAPLRLDCGLSICRHFLVSEKWLADGLSFPKALPFRARSVAVRFSDLRSRIFMHLASGVEIDAKTGRIPYSQGFAIVLSQKYERSKHAWLFEPAIAVSFSDDISLFKNVHACCTEISLQSLEPDRQKRLLWAMVRWARIACQELIEKVSTEPPECFFERALDNIERAHFGDDDADDGWFWGYKVVQASPGEMFPVPPSFLDLPENKVLTNVTATDNVPPVKSTMANLLERLNKATSQRGMKSKLAKVMGVPLANISQWLSGTREPGGETTLRLLHWVEQQERQPNTPGSAINTTKGKKTQIHSQIVYETKPSPPKR